MSHQVPKSGADETNRGRRLIWSNIGAPSNLGGHSGWLSLARELSVVTAGPTGAPQLRTGFIPELTQLRGPASTASHAFGRVRDLVRRGNAPAHRAGAGAAGVRAGGGDVAVMPMRLERFGDTLLLPTLGSRQTEVRLTVHGGVGALRPRAPRRLATLPGQLPWRFGLPLRCLGCPACLPRLQLPASLPPAAQARGRSAQALLR